MDPLLQNIAILLIASFHNCIYAYPNGQVTDSCNTMIPIHGASTQTTTSPYTLSLAKNTYSSGENIAVTLSSTSGTTQFKGFLIQARSGSTSTPVGSFKISSNAQTLTCSSSADSVSHTSGSGKTSIQVTWVAPSSNIADIQIRATIVQTQRIFWTNVVSSKIAYVATASNTTSSTTGSEANNGFQLTNSVNHTSSSGKTSIQVTLVTPSSNITDIHISNITSSTTVGNSTSATTVTTFTTRNQTKSGCQMTAPNFQTLLLFCVFVITLALG